MLKYSELREGLNIHHINGNAESLAYFTHFLHNYQNGVAKSYHSKAENYYQEIKEDLSFVTEPNLQGLLPIHWDIPFPTPEHPKFSFIDLFAGIGGFRIALQKLGGKCVFSSEYDSYAQKAYELNFGEIPFGDITKINLDLVPKHDILCAGFPCQPFSISGKMKGFEDTRGTLIYHVFEIIALRKPKVVFLENVKHLLYHDKRRTLSTIIKNLESLGYKVSYKVLNASDFGIPQNRERIIIIAHQNKQFDFDSIPKQQRPVLKDFLDSENDFEYLHEPYTLIDEVKKQKSGLMFVGYRNKKIRKAGVRPGTQHLSRVHKQPNRIYSTDGVHPALPSQETSGRFWIYHQEKVRKLTIQECFRIMGFPDNFQRIKSKTELYKQIGNSVAVPMIEVIMSEIKNQLLNS